MFGNCQDTKHRYLGSFADSESKMISDELIFKMGDQFDLSQIEQSGSFIKIKRRGGVSVLRRGIYESS
jgi:hypothetical protein